MKPTFVPTTKPTHFLLFEGDTWRTWDSSSYSYRGGAVHAIRFSDGSIFDARNGWRPVEQPKHEDIMRLIAEARARYAAMTLEEKDDHDWEQRRSFVRGQCPSNRNYEEWCRQVDAILPPRKKP